MSVNPFTAGRFRAFDSNGAPLAGGLLYTYLAGTTTPQTTYTDASGATPNANPVVLDSSGYADVWLGTSANYKFVLKDVNSVTQWTVDNWPPSGSGSSGASVSAQTIEPGGRLTLATGTPVSRGDVSSATTIYYTPYKHDQVPLFDGTAWSLVSIGSQISQTTTDNTKSPAACLANNNYDLFVWNDAGTIRLSRGFAWSSGTSRGTGVGTTELTQQNGRYVNKQAITNGPAALCGTYVGSVRADGSAQLNDELGARTVWNMYNRVPRIMYCLGGGSSWIYNTAAWRQANASSANQLVFMRGLDEDAVTAEALHTAMSNAGASTNLTGIGLDSTTALAAACITIPGYSPNSEADYNTDHGGAGCMSATFEDLPGLGFHYLTWLEYALLNAGIGNTFFNLGSAPGASGMRATVLG